MSLSEMVDVIQDQNSRPMIFRRENSGLPLEFSENDIKGFNLNYYKLVPGYLGIRNLGFSRISDSLVLKTLANIFHKQPEPFGGDQLMAWANSFSK